MDVYTREWRDALSCAMPHPLRLHGLWGDVDLVERQAGRVRPSGMSSAEETGWSLARSFRTG